MSNDDPTRALKAFQKQHAFLVGIDSDGCVFDTMEIKHKECFCPNTIKYWDLQGVSKYAREAAEFVNLYSKWRGVNRWPALVKVFDLLRDRPEVVKRNVQPPEVPSLRAFIDSGRPLSTQSLEEEVRRTDDAELRQALAWNNAVNAAIADMVHGIPPFPYFRESVEKLAPQADMICVSQTPCEALEREWSEHCIDRYAAVIAGQEMGTKAEHLQVAAGGKYPSDRILMIGDAPGDLKAARANDALFYPINPGEEEASWQRFVEEACDRFLAGTYAGSYEQALVEEFQRHLPSVPPWQQ